MRGLSVLCALLVLLVSVSNARAARHRRGGLSYVVNKGCLFLAHYVKDNYPLLEPTHDTSVAGVTNWVDWARDIADASYLPQELLEGLIKCGKGYTFYALSAPQHIIQEHGLAGMQLVPGK